MIFGAEDGSFYKQEEVWDRGRLTWDRGRFLVPRRKQQLNHITKADVGQGTVLCPTMKSPIKAHHQGARNYLSRALNKINIPAH